MMTNSNVLSLEIDGAVATITFDQAPANALTTEMVDGIAEALDECEAADTRVAVITSAVPGFFMAGADIKLMGSADADRAVFDGYLDHLTGTIERLATMPMLSIAAIEGYALGGGLEFSCACTFRVASTTAMLGVPEVKLGLLPGGAGTQRLPNMIGQGRALDLMLTGRSVDGEEALSMGLVNRLVEPGEALAAATQWAEQLAGGSQVAYSAIRRCAAAAMDGPFETGRAVERAEILDLFESADGTEGLQAFLEKRSPDFA